MENAERIIAASEKFGVINGKGNSGTTNITSDDMHKAKWVDPIRDIEDIRKIEDYLQERIEQCVDPVRRKIYARNKLLFVLGWRTGFRVNDLIEFKWGMILKKDGNFYANPQRIVENKTGKVRDLNITKKIKEEIEQYIKIADPDVEKNNYVFVGKDKRYELYDVGMEKKIIDDVTVDVNTVEYEDYQATSNKTKQRRIKDSGIKHRGLKKADLDAKKAELDKFNIPYSVRRYHISDAIVTDIVKELVEVCGLEGNYAGRSLRKTYAYRQYINGKNHGMSELDAADNVRKIMNHSTVQITFRYLGLSQKEAITFLEDDDM